MHKFTDSLDRGLKAESDILPHFSAKWEITPASVPLQKVGIDYLFRSRESGEVYGVELKTDFQAGKTGNAFIELDSAENKRGWAYTTKADVILYWVPDRNTVYCFNPGDIRKRITDWKRVYPMKSVPNQGRFEKYTGKGLLVPLPSIAKCSKVIKLGAKK